MSRKPRGEYTGAKSEAVLVAEAQCPASETEVTRRSSRGGYKTLVVLSVVLISGAGWYLLHYRGRSEAADAGNGPAGVARGGAIRNVVLVSIDTCRADRLSCYGYKRPTTPHIDALAGDGTQFTMAMTPVPLTTPAHSSMFTGTYPPTHGVHVNGYDHLAPSNVTLAKTLHEAGYQTAAFVAGFTLDAQFGLNQGFDTYDGRFSEEEKPGAIARRSGAEVNRPAMAWLQDHAQRPFFLFLHYYDAHHPYEPHPPRTSPFSDDPYAGEIAYIDDCIGQVLDRLRALGVYDNTLVIVTGDHGESLGEHGEITHSYFVYQSTLHVPLVIRAPGCGKGLRVDGNVSLVDIVPTVLDLVGLERPARLQGVSLRSALEGGAGPDGNRSLYAESMEAATFACSPLHCIVEGGWKYILTRRPELYDLSQDPGETKDLAGQQPEVAQRLRARLESLFNTLGPAAPGHSAVNVNPAGVNAEAIKRLQSLGYVSGGAAPPASTLDTTREDPKDFLRTYLGFLDARDKLYVGRHIEEAKTELLKIVALRPKLILPHRLLAEIAEDENRPAGAAEEYAKIFTIQDELKDPARKVPGAMLEIASAHNNLANLLRKIGQVPDAVRHYEQAGGAGPNSATASENRGDVPANRGLLDEAVFHYRKALEITPELAETHYNLGTVLAGRGEIDEAIAHYRKAIEISPGFAEAHSSLGRALAGRGQLDEAIGHFRKALEVNPNDPDAHLNLGLVLEQTGNLAEAIGNDEQALRAWPDNAAIHYDLGVALALDGRITQAAAHYAQAIKLQPNLLGALNNLAWIRATSEDPHLRNGVEAVRLAQQACQLTNHQEAGTLDTLAAAYAEAGRFAEATAAAQEALALAESAKQPARVESIQSRLNLYRAGRPYREPPQSEAGKPGR